MMSLRTVTLLGVVAVLATTGVAKIVAPSEGDALPPLAQVGLGLAESVAAILLLVRRPLRPALMYLCAAGALAGVLFHSLLAPAQKSCGCLGGLTPQGMGPALAAALGACSCLWLSLQYRRTPSAAGGVRT